MVGIFLTVLFICAGSNYNTLVFLQKLLLLSTNIFTHICYAFEGTKAEKKDSGDMFSGLDSSS